MITELLNIFKKPHTANYPAEPLEKVKERRGLIEHNAEECIWCDKCEKVCPPGAILFYQYPDGSKKYRYNTHLCIYCGECVRDCPKPDEALTQTNKKPLPVTAESRVNNDWFEWEAACKNARDDYKELKRKEKEEKAKAKAKAEETPLKD
jgi:NADH-quinone oxidoreductase subunit I